VTVGIAEDLATFVAELAEELCVRLEEAVNPLFEEHRVSFLAPESIVAGDHSLIGNKTLFEESLGAVLFLELFIGPHTSLWVYSTIVEANL